jgi:hypothetical protein
MTGSGPSAAREFLDDADIPASARGEFLDSLNAFLTTDAPTLSVTEDVAQLTVWGQTLSQVAAYLFATARALSPKPPKPSPKKVYNLTPSEVEIWQELQNSRSKSQTVAEIPPMPSSELFVVDNITDGDN